MTYFLAVDIGASSGRHIVAWMENGEIQTKETFRFPNGVQEKDGHLIWDMPALVESVISGIQESFRQFPQIESLAKFKVSGKQIEIIDDRAETESFVIFGVRACDCRSFDILDSVSMVFVNGELVKE